jgi:response regulator RpfG family c-di-GMP phosphodiesterase
MNRKIRIAVISTEENFKKRTTGLSDLFSASVEHYISVDQFSETAESAGPEAGDIRFIIIDAIGSKSPNDTTGMVQVAKFVGASAGIAVVAAKKVNAEDTVFIKKSGASLVLMENEYFENSKLEFVVTRYLNGDWIPIKVADLMKDKPVNFVLHHMMPLNGRMLPILQIGQLLESPKLKKFESIGEFYIRRHDLQGFADYCKENVDNSAESLVRRCRAVYMSLVETYKDLVMLLTDQSEAASFDRGRELYQQLLTMSSDFISSLASVGQPWQVINNSSVSDFSAVDRAPAVAAYAGLLSLEIDIGKPEEVMVAALLADIGLLDISFKSLAPLKAGVLAQMTENDQKIYRFHPTVSLNNVLARKVPVPEHIKQIILATHEKSNGKGFPNGLEKEKIPVESFLIQFSEQMDMATVVSFGKARRPILEIQQEVLKKELHMGTGTYPLDLCKKIADHWARSQKQ